MKKYLFGIFAGLVILFTGCLKDDDSYSLDKMWVGFGIVDKQGPGYLSYTITMDDGSVLYPSASNAPGFAVEDKGRVLVNYTILGDKNVSGDQKAYYVKINSLRKILMKGILDITPAIEDSIGNDPIYVRDYWISKNLLNFELRYWGSYEVHYINLVKQPGVLTPANEPIELELRHNKNGDREEIPFSAFVSFDLSSIKLAGRDSVRFVVRSTDYNGDEKSFNGVFHYEGDE
ncbi:MAG TPA: NigD-like protein [Prolixibacteraceae bacterium]|nr:NigD-like protein [Prolixibacteraceae bacterium]